MQHPHPAFAVLLGCLLTVMALIVILPLGPRGIIFWITAFTVAALVSGAVFGVGFGAVGALTGAAGAFATLLLLWIPVVLNTLGLALVMTPLFLAYAIVVLAGGLLSNWMASVRRISPVAGSSPLDERAQPDPDSLEAGNDMH
ncbi:MAG: hypothetical protein U1F48_05605 [Burkholderiales bacterium]